MTERDKQDIAEIVAIAVKGAMAEHGPCSLGIKPETAHELISFAVMWKDIRKKATGAFILIAIGGALTALWVGFKTMLK